MTRAYERATDFERVGRFLVRTYRSEGAHINWLQSRWEYMHFHPLVHDVDLSRIGVWESAGEIALPSGFRLQSLAEENDLHKVDRLLWRGFGHGDEPEDDGIEGRALMQSAPHHRLDLNIVVVAPEGHFVSYFGMWYEPVHAVALVEPVATDPDYRGMGLGRAAVPEGIRRCSSLGATVAWVGSGQPFYQSFGFRVAYQTSAWRREFLTS